MENLYDYGFEVNIKKKYSVPEKPPASYYMNYKNRVANEEIYQEN